MLPPKLVWRWFCLLVGLLPGYLDAARILALYPIPSFSHFYHSLPYLKGLASLEHEITLVSPFSLEEPFNNIHEILVPELFDYNEELLKILTTSPGTWEYNDYINNCNLNLAKKVLNNDGVRREILKPGKTQFDLIIIDLWRMDALYGLAAYFEAPIIGVASYDIDWKIDELVGNASPMSYLQSPSFNWHNLETYTGRLAHFIGRSIAWGNWRWRYEENHEALYRKYFPKIADKKPLSEITRNFALMLVNQHFTLAPPRPLAPNVIEVGGMHISQQPTALPQDLEEFIQGSGEDGVIFFSLGTHVRGNTLTEGTHVRGNTLSEDRLKVLLETFESLPQRILWKFDDEQLAGKPSNVLIKKWFPQQDILAHPKVKLFITHGGLQSTVESINYGKPMLGLPFFADQFRNMEHVSQQGLGLVLNFKEMTTEEFKDTILRLLEEKSFDVMARTIAARYRDQPIKPLENAIWWTHYILRHKGATYMRVAARELDFITYHNLDVLGSILLVICIVFSVAALCVLKSLKMILRRKSPKKNRKQKVR
ncbi:hypothetical protein KR054_006005 [Drosophila jambulina]|nr:hypothetical protein KR054_006005 [Drosophila jambulina]